MTRRSIPTLALALLAATTAFAPSAAGVTVQVIAASFSVPPAPGGGGFFAFAQPLLNDAGQVAFRGDVGGPRGSGEPTRAVSSR